MVEPARPAIDAALPWIRALKDCPQDPIHHAEGDVWIHTRMVCEALAGLETWRALPDREREIVFWSALLHDVAERLRRQNRERPNAVPEKVLDQLLKRWEIPDPSEAHRVEYWVDGEKIRSPFGDQPRGRGDEQR